MYYTSYYDFLDSFDSFIFEVKKFEKRQKTPKPSRPQSKIIILIINEGTPYSSGRSPPFCAPGRLLKNSQLIFIKNYVIIFI